ncbi:MAG TPA: putative molybdenum carrier protein [Nocardioides sp.]|nr:putative molybdenum carrier protein [Nocardioides sp.]
MPAPRVARLVSGGQTGADRACLDLALARRLEYGGWCPRGGWAEDLTEPPGLLARYPLLRESSSSDPDVRTRLNVRDSHATLVVRPDAVRSPGTDLATSTALELGRPHLTTDGSDAEVVAQWLCSIGAALTLNVAGPRESEHAGSYRLTWELLDRLLGPAPSEGPGAVGSECPDP